MTIIKKFLERRSEYFSRENISEDNTALTDDEFWLILKQFKQETRSGKKTSSEILEEILEQYSVSKMNQFADRYKNLNK